MCNRTQNDAIWGLITLFLTNQIVGNTIGFKMNVIKILITPKIIYVIRYPYLVVHMCLYMCVNITKYKLDY